MSEERGIDDGVLEVICCDTSYSDHTCVTGRGVAAFSLNFEWSDQVTEVVNKIDEKEDVSTTINQTSTPSSSSSCTVELNHSIENIYNSEGSNTKCSIGVSEVYVRGKLPNNEAVNGQLSSLYIGKCTSDGWWVVTQQTSSTTTGLSHIDEFLLSRTTGRLVETRWVDINHLHMEFENT